MAKIFGQDFSRRELGRWTGSPSQVAGTKLYQLIEGKGNGMRFVDFWTGSGLEFTVSLDRAMDISCAFYKGKSLCWRSATGDVHPHFFEREGFGWYRSFPGGLLLTCGLTNVGEPCEDKGEKLGLHGRISHIPAEKIKVGEGWRDGEYVLSVEGRMRQCTVFGENLLLRRRVWTKMGGTRFWIEDRVENEVHKASPLMILYHLNIGFPVVSECSRLLFPTVKVTPLPNEGAAKEEEDYAKFGAPTPGFEERVYYHQMKADKTGFVRCAVVNDELEGGGLGVYVAYKLDQLPNFVQWKMLGEGEYVVGMEPANCGVEGRRRERGKGELPLIKPGEAKEFSLEVGVLEGIAPIEQFERKLACQT